MREYFVTTDSTADVPRQFFEEGFKIVDITYTLDGVVYDGAENPFLSAHEFYAKLEKGVPAGTSMVPVERSALFFEEILKSGKDVLHIALSSALSGTYEGYEKAAELLKKKYPDNKVIVIDSKCASCGEALLCYYALKKRKQGASLEENAAYINDLKNHVGHAFTPENLTQLYRGGRLSRGAAAIGNVLQMKPLLWIDARGALTHSGNSLGRKLALKALVDRMVSSSRGCENDTIVLGSAEAQADAESVAKMIKAKLPAVNVVIGDIGPAIGCHVGKGTICLIFLCNHR